MTISWLTRLASWARDDEGVFSCLNCVSCRFYGGFLYRSCILYHALLCLMCKCHLFSRDLLMDTRGSSRFGIFVFRVCSVALMLFLDGSCLLYPAYPLFRFLCVII